MKTAVDRSAQQLRGVGEQQVTSMLSDRISRAFLLDGPAGMMALDFNARLVTELRERRMWPARLQHPCADGE